MKSAAVIIGASSGLGKSLAEELASKGNSLVLAARHERDLSVLAADLSIRYNVSVNWLVVDLGKINEEEAGFFTKKCFDFFETIDAVYITAAMIHDGDNGIESVVKLSEITAVNYRGIAYLVADFCKRLSGKKATISIMSSIAAIRPRGNNIAYSASKAALEYFIKGLQHFYSNDLLKLQIYRLGYMDTGMSHGKKLLFPKAAPKRVANYILSRKNKRLRLAYYPHFWGIIALLLKSMPWFMYKRIKF
ncbi:MAG: SDR family NAD(P)-dependent oxidoreductase [Chitinophagaceae bacterium]